MAATSARKPCRAPDGSAQGIRPSKSTRWRFAVLIGVHVLFVLHIVHLRATGSTVSPVEPSEAMEYSKHSVINAGFVFFAVTILGTLIFGRFFCGWGCHLVALQDLARALLLRVGIRPRPLRSRLLLLVPSIAFVYMFLWPAIYRMWVGDAFESTQDQFFTSDFWRTFPGLIVALVTLLVCGFASVYFLGAKGFCTYACPYGAIFGAVDHVAPGRIRVTDACKGCGHCTASCTSNVLVHQEVHDHGMVVDPGCMKCLDCVSVCPENALFFGLGKPSLLAKPRHAPKKRKPAFSRTEEGLLGFTFLAAFLAFRGLYQTIPFLLSLGLAGIAAYTSLCAWRMLRVPRVRLQNWTLKSEGKLTPAGRTFSIGFLLFGSLWAHSGWIQFHTWRAGNAMQALAGTRARWTRLEHEPLDDGERELLAALGRHNRQALRFGLATPEGAYRAAWERLFHDDRSGYARWMERGVELETRGASLALEYAGFLNAGGQLDEAEEVYRRALELGEDAVQVAADLARFLAERRGDLAGAREVLRRALETHPREAALHDGLGVLCTAAGDAPGAVSSFRRAVELEPGHFEFRDRLVTLLMATGASSEGLEVLREGVDLNPNGTREQTALGLGLLATGDIPGAETVLRDAIKLDPTAAGPAIGALIQLLRETGRAEEAQQWTAGIRPDPDRAPD